jgi:hypothetical protein
MTPHKVWKRLMMVERPRGGSIATSNDQTTKKLFNSAIDQQGLHSEKTTDNGGKNTIQGKEKRRIWIATFNIRNGRQGNLESALRALMKMNVDIGLLEETKIKDEKYKKKSFGYNVIATRAESVFEGGITLVYRSSPFWTIESIRLYNPNSISFELITGIRRYACVGVYIPPSDTITVDTITTALKAMPPMLPLILMGNLNAEIERPRDNRAKEVAFLEESFGLEDLMRHFRQRERFRRGITWRI